MKNLFSYICLFALGMILFSCQTKENKEVFNFDTTNNRIWIGQDFWSVPMEDWRVENGRIECIADRGNSRVNMLTQHLSGKGDLKLSVKTGILKNKNGKGTVGFTIGLQDNTDNDVRSLCYFGKGTQVGVDLSGKLFIGDETTDLPEGFDYSAIQLHVDAKNIETESWLKLTAIDKNGLQQTLEATKEIPLRGIFTLANNHPGKTKAHGTFWFDDLSVSGTMVEHQPENSFGPMLWSMYTLSRQQMKLTVQMPPIGENDEQNIELQLKEGQKWKTTATAQMEKNARIATFSVDNWDDSKAKEYRLVYNEKFTDGKTIEHTREGIIQKDPADKPVEMGAMTGQFGYGFPYRPLVEQLKEKNPDILFFSGDQIYEPNGGYGIIRFPAERAILSYLGKWYMFGWAFGDLMKDRPTICLPDDHDVLQGNIWGNGGKKVTVKNWNKSMDATSGFVEPVEMVNVVIRTNTSHQPAPFDPTPIKQGIEVYYTDVLYGRVSFALVSDRMFKSGPEEVVEATKKAKLWRGRKDMLVGKYPNSSPEVEKSLNLLGDRQMTFLKHWATDWKGADLKVLLSQTIFVNNVTHYGPQKVVLGADLDSGGWPKIARDKTVDLLRRCYAFQVCGDQHLASLVQYGIDNYKDASWVFCTPAIAVGYQRRFLPDILGRKYTGRPAHNAPNTGLYTDGFGNLNFVYAVGNPNDIPNDANRYQQAQNRASGFGYITFNQQSRDITSNAYRFLQKEDDEKQRGEFEGWPKTINQLDNFTSNNQYALPKIEIKGAENAYVEIRSKNSELESAIRIKGSNFAPRVSKPGDYRVTITNAKDFTKKQLNLSTQSKDKNVIVEF